MGILHLGLIIVAAILILGSWSMYDFGFGFYVGAFASGLLPLNDAQSPESICSKNP